MVIMQITSPLLSRSIEAVATIRGETVESMLMPTLTDLSNGSHIRNGRREPLTEDYVSWLESEAVRIAAARSAQLHQDIGA